MATVLWLQLMAYKISCEIIHIYLGPNAVCMQASFPRTDVYADCSPNDVPEWEAIGEGWCRHLKSSQISSHVALVQFKKEAHEAPYYS